MTTKAQPLFRSVGTDDAVYLLVIEGHERWTIQRDGIVIANGPTDEAGISDAIATFRSLPVATPRHNPALRRSHFTSRSRNASLAWFTSG